MHKRLQFFWLRWCANTSFCRKQVACAWLHTWQASKNAVLQFPAQNEIRRKDFHADPKALVQAFLAIAEDKNKPPWLLTFVVKVFELSSYYPRAFLGMCLSTIHFVIWELNIYNGYFTLLNPGFLVLKVALQMDDVACHTGWLFRRRSPE